MQSTKSLEQFSECVVNTLFEAKDVSLSSSSDPPLEEWSSFLVPIYEKNPKLAMYEKGLFSPGSGEVCAKYIALSDSEVMRHPYYKYPAVDDPGIVSALCDPDPEKIYDDVGQDLYLDLCDETGMAPVKMFHKGLLNNVINLKYYCVNPNGVRNMCLALAGNHLVQRLDLTSSFLNHDACYHLGELMSRTSTLKELILTQCRIGYFGLLRLIKPLDIINLKNLDLSKNLLGDEGMAVIAEKIIKGAKIKKLNLSHNDIGINGALELANAFTYNRTCFTHLNLSGNLLVSPRALKSLITSLYSYSKLIELDLSWCGISGGKFIADILMAKSLKKLDLSHNCLTREAVEALRTKLRTTKTLKILNLSSNPLQPKEAYAMLQELRYSQVKLAMLLMDEIDVTKEFPREMEKILALTHRKNTKVTHGRIMSNYTLQDADFREIMIKRLDYLGRSGPKKNRVDIPAYILRKRKEATVLLPKRMMMDLQQMGSIINLDFLERLPIAFPGPRVDKKTRAIDLESLADYTARIWPDTKALPTPPPTEDLNPHLSRDKTSGSSGNRPSKVPAKGKPPGKKEPKGTKQTK